MPLDFPFDFAIDCFTFTCPPPPAIIASPLLAISCLLSRAARSDDVSSRDAPLR